MPATTALQSCLVPACVTRNEPLFLHGRDLDPLLELDEHGRGGERRGGRGRLKLGWVGCAWAGLTGWVGVLGSASVLVFWFLVWMAFGRLL